jgi:hypothetical protein
MSFNWPDIPFTGAEVEAFVDAYKGLAESIINDYDNYIIDPSELKSPYRYKENTKLFLEYGLLYSAFIIKQRAGNSGPGTSFILGNSPYQQSLNSKQKKKIAESMGCVWDPEQIKDSYDENVKNDPDGDLPSCEDIVVQTQMGVGITPCNIIDDLVGDGEKPPCQDFWNKLRDYWKQVQGLPPETEEEPSCLAIVLPALVNLIAKATDIGLALMYGLMVEYLNGSGGVVDNNRLNSISKYGADVYLLNRVTELMQRPKGSHDFGGYSIQLSNQNSSIYGINGGRVWTVSSANDIRYPSLKNILGDFTVVTNGTETYSIDSSVPAGQWDTPTGKAYFTSLSSSSIKQIRDDYDFDDYGWKLVRSYQGNDLPGESFTDSQIQSGFLYTNSATAPCEAVNQGGGIGQDFYSGTARWIVANTHGTGRKEQGEYDPNKPCQGKPFAIKLLY